MDLKAVAPHVIKVNPAAIKPVSVTPETTAPVILAVVPGGPGAEGKSAYRLAVDAGFSGDEAAWLASLKGEDGDPGPANSLSIGTVDSGDTAAATITGDAPEQTLNLVLPKGADGKDGKDGSGGGGGGGSVALPPGMMQLKGAWDASANVPTLTLPNEIDLALFGFSATRPTRIALDPVAFTLYICDGDQVSTLNLNTAAAGTVPLTGVTGVIGLALFGGSVYVAAKLSGAVAVIKWDGSTQTQIPFTGIDAIRDIAVAGDGTVWITATVGDAKALVAWDGTTQTTVEIPAQYQTGAWDALCALPNGSVCADGTYIIQGATVTLGGVAPPSVAALATDGKFMYAALGNAGIAKLSLDASASVALDMPNPHSNFSGIAFGSSLLFYSADDHVYMLVGLQNPGELYRVTTAGTQDIGDGPVDFVVGDYVLCDGIKFHKL